MGIGRESLKGYKGEVSAYECTGEKMRTSGHMGRNAYEGGVGKG